MLHTGSRVLMVNGRDTLLAAALNGHGQPMILEMGDKAIFHPHTFFTFQYDNQNRFISSIQSPPGSPNVYKHTYQYDESGNVIRISGSEPSVYTAFSYDYSRPIKGGDFEVMGMGKLFHGKW